MAVFSVAIIAVIVLAVSSKGNVQNGLRIGEAVPGVSLKDLSGKNVKLPEDSRGKVVFVHFWTSSCTYCVKEMCSLESLYRKRKSEGVIAYSVNAGDDKRTAAAYIENLKITYPVLLDQARGTARQYGVTGVPTTYVLDRQGVLRYKVMGEITPDRIDAIIKALL